MRPLLLPILFAFAIVSCRKSIESDQNYPSYLSNVKNTLKDSLTVKDFENLDLSKAIITHPDSIVHFLRVPFKGISTGNRFVLLKTNHSGAILQGYIIDLKKDIAGTSAVYNGIIEIRFLNETLRLKSPIKNGYITEFHSTNATLRSLVVPTEAHVLPEVVVTCYINSVESFGYSDWLNISSLLGGGSDGYYGLLGNYGAGGDGGGGGGALTPDNGDVRYESYQNGRALNSEISYDDQLIKDNPILVDFEFTDALTPINIDKYLKCFSTIPDAGSTCSIEIFSDIPVDDRPDVFFDWNTGSPGHTFLQIQKTLGNQTVVQNIGFYPVHGWKTITTGPVEGMFVDNSSHEYNAGLKMYLTPDQLKNTLNQMNKIAHQVKYDIDEYNCTDFALDIFNFSRPANPLEIPKYHLTGSTAPNGSNTPQGLYKKIAQMQGVSVEAPNITIPHSKQFVTKSSGPCN